jgi:hypothetical protein
MRIVPDADDVTPCTLRERVSLVEVLEGRHGQFAASVAEFFRCHHDLRGNITRAQAWADVAELVRRREQQRMLET